MSQSLPITLNPWSEYAIFSQNVPESGRYWHPHCQLGSWWMLTKSSPNWFNNYICPCYTHSYCLNHCPLPLIHVKKMPFLIKMFLIQEEIDIMMWILGQWAVYWANINVRFEFSIQNSILSPTFINIHQHHKDQKFSKGTLGSYPTLRQNSVGSVSQIVDTII